MREKEKLTYAGSDTRHRLAGRRKIMCRHLSALDVRLQLGHNFAGQRVAESRRAISNECATAR